MTLLDAIEGAHQKLLRPSGGCHNCPRHLVDFVPATLLPTTTLFIGEGPGKDEVEQGEGFVGKSGQLLRREAGEVGLTEFSVTNVTHCRPPKNATPKAKEIACCLSQFVLDEVRDYPIVVLCGAVPLKAFFPGAIAAHFRGNVAHHPDFPGQRFYSMYHPAAILRNPELKGAFQQQIARLARIAAGEPKPSWNVLQGGGEEWWAAFETCLAAPLISLDLETPDLKSWNPYSSARSFAVTADAKTVLFANAEDPHWIPALEKLCNYLRQPEKGVVANNIGFDLDWLEHEQDFQVKCTGIHDIGVIWYQARQYKQVSQKELVSRELDGYRWLIHQPQISPDPTILPFYNGEDAVYALQLFYKGLRLLKPNTRDLVTRVVGPTVLCLRQITSNGFYLRQAYREQMIEEYEGRRRDVIAAWQEEDSSFVPSIHESGKGLHEYLFSICRLPILARTEKGDKPSTDQAVIRQWIHDGAGYLKHLLKMREIDKLLSTYLTAYDKFVEPTSRVHSQYPLTRTDTGRSSSHDPNLQNVARPRKIRDLFGVPPGAVLIEGDLNQIEFRIMICLSRDETGIAGYLRGDDVHTITAKNFAPNPTKEERNRAKPINFALIYGGSEYVVQSVAFNDYGLDWPIEQCEEFTTIFFNTYKRLPEFHRASHDKLVRNRGWFESVLGHIFHYRDWDNGETKRRDHAFRSALNSEAQGPAAHICFAIMVQARRLLNAHNLSQVRFVNTVHDSVVIEAPRPALVEGTIECMEEAVAIVYEWVKPWFMVPLVMDYKTGEAWGSLETYRRGTKV